MKERQVCWGTRAWMKIRMLPLSVKNEEAVLNQAAPNSGVNIWIEEEITQNSKKSLKRAILNLQKEHQHHSSF